MQPGALKALEFDRIVEAVRRFAQTPLGAARLADLRPHTDPRKVEAVLAVTTEATKLLAEAGRLPLAAFAEIDATLASLAIEGRVVDPLRLRGLAGFLASVDETRGVVRQAREPLPALRTLAEGAASFEREVGEVRKKIEPSGDVVDHASDALRSVRDRLRKQRSRLRSMLESYLRGKETAKFLQEQIVTDRNGRYVLVVRAEHRTAIPGIVHGSSASGASLFLEPLSTVEINNDIVALQAQEAEEIRRILLELSNSFRARALELHRTIEAATEIDVAQAKARFAVETGSTEPALAADGRLELRAARHPLLVLKGSGVVANDIVTTTPVSALIVTGPNTGGKTVALKTVGLLALMAQAGLHVTAAAGSKLPVFRSIFADIGDEQSIQTSLSTFSSHMTNIVAMDRAMTLPALVLVDEVGAGTDPIEGGALAIGIVEHFRKRGALVVATTHYDALKSYAATTDGVACTAFGFDPDTFEPTYRLVYGAPGRSLAFEVAARLGMPAAVIETARRHRSAREAQLADHLAKIDRDMSSLDHERRLAGRERERLAELEQKLRAREDQLHEREERSRRRLDEQVADRLRDARLEIDGIVDELRRRVAALSADAERRAAARETPLPTGETGGARAAARAALDALAERLQGGPDAAATPFTTRDATAGVVTAPAQGDRVGIGALGLEGVVRAVHEHDVEVEVRGKRLRVPAGDVRVIGAAPAAPPAVHVDVHLAPREGATGADLNVIGCTVDEALARAEKFLDEALVLEQKTVRVIHGFGTGQLRRAIGEFLNRHPLVARHWAAPPDEGGGGVTVVELKD